MNDSAPPPAAKGLLYMVASCALFAAMSGLVYAAQLREPQASSLVSSFVRVAVNLLILVAGGVVGGDWQDLIGDRRASLWWRGVFGSLSVIATFSAIKAIGVGEASFLTASNGVFVALAAPYFLRQPNSAKVWVAITGAVVGLFLLFQPRLTDVAPWGRLVALSAGFFSALAYMMIARAGRSNSPNSVIFYFCVTALVLHLGLFAVLDVAWPGEPRTWLLLCAGGVCGSYAQVCLTKAYQRSPAALNSAVSYLQPVLNLGISVVFFAKIPDAKAWLGAGIVVVFGVMLPFVKRSPRGPRSLGQP